MPSQTATALDPMPTAYRPPMTVRTSLQRPRTIRVPGVEVPPSGSGAPRDVQVRSVLRDRMVTGTAIGDPATC